ncbi:hypothetical protein ACPF8X_28440, partial [Streptomyces sp. G35A]
MGDQHDSLSLAWGSGGRPSMLADGSGSGKHRTAPDPHMASNTTPDHPPAFPLTRPTPVTAPDRGQGPRPAHSAAPTLRPDPTAQRPSDPADAVPERP